MKFFLRLNIVQIFFGIVSVGIWLYFSEVASYLDNLKQIRPIYIILLFGIILFSIFSRFVRWQFILRRIGIRIPARPSFAIYLSSLIGIATPAYLGEMIRGLFMKRKFRIPFRITIWVFVVERLLDIAALGIIGIFSVNTWGIKKLMALVIATLFPLGFFSVMLLPKVVPLSAIKNMRKGTMLLSCIAISLIAWVPAALLIPVAASGIDVSIDYISGMGIFSTAAIIGGMALIPASIGSTGSIAIQQIENLNISLTQGTAVVSLVLLVSVGMTLFIGTVSLLIELKVKKNEAPSRDISHFDEITPEYKGQFTSHVWDHLLEKKISFIDSVLANPFSKKGPGLDLGCGLGKQCLAMNKRGYSVVGLDYSYNLTQQARLEGVKVVNGDALMLPFQESSFEYVYTVGALHHLPGLTEQEAACREILRVLKPGGYLIVHESNTRNPLFRFYMGYIFPLLKSIDEGTESWIEPQRWEKIEGMKFLFVKYFTFIPDFIPNFLMRPSLSFEKKLESGRLRFYSVHYMAVLQKPLT